MENKNTIQTNSFILKTNRQFYCRKKKQPTTRYLPQMEKALKILIRKSGNDERKNRQNIKTEKNQALQYQTSRIQDIQALKRNLHSLLQDLHPRWLVLLKAFDCIFDCVSLRKLEESQVYFYEQFKQLANIHCQKKKLQENQKSKQKVICRRQSNEKQNNIFLLQNIKLQKQNKMLRTQIIKYGSELIFSSENDIRSVQKGSEQQSNRNIALQRKLTTQMQQNQILRKQLEYIREQIVMMRDEKKNLQGRISEFKIKNENLCSQIISLQLKNRSGGLNTQKKQQIMYMQREQIQSYQREASDQRRVFVNLSRKYHNLINKFKKIKTDDNCKMAVLYNRQYEIFPQQFEAFDEVRNKMIAVQLRINNGPQTPLLTKDKRNSKIMKYQQFIGVKQSLNNQEGVKKLSKNNYAYYYPTFYHLVADDVTFYGIDQNNYQHFNQKIKLNFLGTIRAIMDSKYNQFILHQDHRLFTSFSAFVYSWLNTFQLDSKKKINILTNSSTCSRQILSTFYVNLMSEKLNYSWEIITFREFLLQTFQVDQLYYYLGLRFYILEGDISKTLDYCFQEIYYIDYSKGLNLLNHFIRQEDSQYLKILEQFLKRATVYNRKKGYLDLHFLMRIMLEYYQYMKQCQIQKIAKTISVIAQNKKSSISFSQFLKIFEYHFEYLSLTQKIDLYRKCYCIGKGNISFQILISMLNSQHIFVKWIDRVFLCQPIRIQEKKISSDVSRIKINPNHDFLYEIQEKYQFIFNTQLKRQSYQTGMENLHKQIHSKTKLNAFNIHDRLQGCFKVCMLFSKKLYRSNSIKLEELSQTIVLVTDFLQRLSKLTMQKSQILQIMQYFKYRQACRRIVKFYQNKKQEMTRSIMYVYSNNSMKYEDTEKNQTIRTQFMNIITQMKGRSKVSSNKLLD